MKAEEQIHKFIDSLGKFEWQRITQQLFSLKENYDKIKFALSVLEKENILSDYKSSGGKNNEKSVDYRKSGNTYFSLQNKDYPRALEYYNKSICYAELNTECLATGYANRSAIYYEWKMYTICLENIELAFKSSASIPDKLREKLINRKKSCLDNINQGNESDRKTLNECDPIKLSYPAHPTVPFIVDSLELDCNNKFGRYIKTTRDLYPGDCIAIERPLFAMLEPDQIYTNCAHCLTENKLSLIPCSNCTATMYCSESCLTSAYTNSHRFTCSAINDLTTLFSNVQLAALEIVIKLFANDNYLNKIFDYLKNNIRPTTVYDFDYKSPYDYADEYKLLHSFDRSESIGNNNNKEIFCIPARAAILYKLVKTNKFLKEIFLKSTVGRNYEDLFLNLLYHNSKPFNFIFPLGRINNMENLANYCVYGLAIYPFSTLLNHSCAPNVIKIYHGGLPSQVMVVTRKISNGEQLFFNNGDTFVLKPRRMRQNYLKEHLHLNCICDACELDYPTYYNLKVHPNLPESITFDVRADLCTKTNDRQYARKLLEIAIDYLKKYDEFYLTRQVVDAEEALKLCLKIMLS